MYYKVKHMYLYNNVVMLPPIFIDLHEAKTTRKYDKN